jgi:hypothetical protein
MILTDRSWAISAWIIAKDAADNKLNGADSLLP